MGGGGGGEWKCILCLCTFLDFGVCFLELLTTPSSIGFGKHNMSDVLLGSVATFSYE